MFVQILVQVGGDGKWKTSRTTLRTPTPLVIRDCFLVYCARTWRISFPPYLQMSDANRKWTLAWEPVWLSAFSVWTLHYLAVHWTHSRLEQTSKNYQARCKSACSTQSRVSLLESSMLLKNLMEARNQKICKGSWPHSLSTAQFVVLFFTPRMRLKNTRPLRGFF